MSSFALTDEERNALMENVYGGYVRSPEVRTWGRGSEWNPRKRNAGKIDYLAYGGESKNYHDNRALDAITRAKEKGYKPNYEGMDDYYKDAYRNRDTWGKVAKHLGIDKVDDEGDLREMYDFVRGYKKEEEDSTDDTEKDYTLKPYGTRIPYGNKPKAGNAPRLEDAYTGDASMRAIRGGDDLNEWYQKKFVPHLEADANATNSEIGDDSRYFLKNFVFDPPKLGDIKEIFDRYKGEIEDLD